MGCATSKLSDSPPVLLCRHRCDFLDQAIHHRFAFARSHTAYLRSLNAVGVSLENFFAGDLASSPEIKLPKRSKGEPDSPESFQGHHHIHSRSHSGSHLHFHSGEESDSDEYDSDSLHHIEERPRTIDGGGGGGVPLYEHGYFDGGFMKLNYMRNQPTPSIVYAQKPIGETVRLGEESSSYFSSKYAVDDNLHQNLPPYLNGYSSPPPNYRVVGEGNYPNSKPQAPPPPPSPPRTTAWDFLNPFQTFDNYYRDYSLGNNEWKDIREEGMPDLEYDEEEVVKEVHGDRKFVVTSSKEVATEDSGPSSINADSEAGPSVVSEKVEYSLQKNVIDDDERPKAKANLSRGGIDRNSDPIKEIQIQFQQVSESGNEIAEFLEVGKLRYKPKHKVPTRFLHLPAAVSLRISAPKKSNNNDSELSDLNPELNQRAKNLSSTLHEIYLWEKKLYEEVKSEEKLRILHQRKSIKFVNLDRKGAEAHRVDNTRTLLRSLSTKINMAIQVVDKISRKINGLRDGELCPQLYDFIHGLTRMWKSMFESHRAQREAIEEAKKLDTITPQFEAICQLENDLINWATSFIQWFSAQRGYVQALNNWLLKCLLYIPEETPDGPVPFSPGRLGAPPIFVICNQWSQSLDRVSNHDVVESMQELTRNVLRLSHRGQSDPKKLKEIESMEKRIGQISSLKGENGLVLNHRAVYQSETKTNGSVGGSLQRVLEAMEKLTGDCLKVYEELQQCIVDIHSDQRSSMD